MYLPGDRSPVNVLRKGGRSPDGELALYLRARIFFRRFAVHGSRGDERREWEDGTSPRLIKSLMRQHAFRPFPLSQDTGGRVMVPGKGTLDGTMHQPSELGCVECNCWRGKPSTFIVSLLEDIQALRDDRQTRSVRQRDVAGP